MLDWGLSNFITQISEFSIITFNDLVYDTDNIEDDIDIKEEIYKIPDPLGKPESYSWYHQNLFLIYQFHMASIEGIIYLPKNKHLSSQRLMK